MQVRDLRRGSKDGADPVRQRFVDTCCREYPAQSDLRGAVGNERNSDSAGTGYDRDAQTHFETAGSMTGTGIPVSEIEAEKFLI